VVNYNGRVTTALGSTICPSCKTEYRIKKKELAALAGAFLASRRKVRAGNPKKLSPCKYCREVMGVNDRREHEPKCPKKPDSVRRGQPKRPPPTKKELAAIARLAAKKKQRRKKVRLAAIRMRELLRKHSKKLPGRAARAGTKTTRSRQVRDVSA